MTKRIGLLTAGSDCPGLNAAIRAIGKAAREALDAELVAFQDGFLGLIYDQVAQPPLSGILTQGGTILGTSREQPQRMILKDQPVDMTGEAVQTYKKRELDVLVCIGGEETQSTAYHLVQQGLNVITLPKGVDNDLAMTELTIGFETALQTATEAIDRLHSTAYSHHRIILVEVLGRRVGWLALGAGLAGGADVIIIPEIPYSVDRIAEAIDNRERSGKRFSIVAVAEGGISKDTLDFFNRSKDVNHMLREGQEAVQVDQQLEQIKSRLTGNTIFLADQLARLTGLETRITILGHLLRGGAPSAGDRVLATTLGTACVEMIKAGKTGVMVAQQDGHILPVPLEQVAGKRKSVPPNHPWIESARCVGTCFGE